MSTNSKSTDNNMTKNPLEVLMTAYGPYAFGVTSLLIIWFTIVAPELKSRQLDYDKHNEIVSQQKAMAETMKMTALTLQSTATTMEATATTMEATAQLLSETASQIGIE